MRPCSRRTAAAVLFAAVPLLALGTAPGAGPTPPTPEGRALGYLAREVPRWSRENRCFSCHNDGDAARALYDGRRRGLAVPPEALAETTAWLARPEGWDRNGGDGPFSDKALARLQFTTALAAALAAGATDDRDALRRAAAARARDQAADGAWLADPGGGGDGDPGAPASYGRPLATLAARDALRAADPDRFRATIDRADRWLRGRPLISTLDAALALLAEPGGGGGGDGERRRRALGRLLAGQSGGGGWGPFPGTPPEPFDSALALLALTRSGPAAEARDAVRRGRDYLVATQRPGGDWPETTRPAGAESYAQRVSTAGWAALALLATSGADSAAPDGER